MQEALQPLAEMLILVAAIVLGSRVLVSYVARLAAWVDSGFTWSAGPVTTGAEGMLRRRGVARTALDPGGEGGKVKVAGELWNAVASEPVSAGGEVEVIAVEGLTLRVTPRPAPISPPPDSVSPDSVSPESVSPENRSPEKVSPENEAVERGG